MAIAFDGPNKLIILSLGTVDLSVRDLWSRWVDWSSLSDNSKYPQAMRSVGGDSIDISDGTSVPVYTYLLNGWRIRAQEANHTLDVSNGILLVDGGGDPFISTIGSFVVRINYKQPVQAITVATGGSTGPTAGEIAIAVVAALSSGTPIPVDITKVAGTSVTGLGTEGNPWRPA